VNVLKNTRAYLIGTIQYAEDGRGWRHKIKSELGGRGIKFYDPYYKPFIHNVPEDETSREEMLAWMAGGNYDAVTSRMKLIRGYDLRLCDICDWFVVVIKPSLASWGSAEELSVIVKEQKPVFLVIDDPLGKKATPLWIMAMVNHNYIYNSVDEMIDTVIGIDDGKTELSSDKWKLLQEELR
jgi:hypothetical protein